LTTFYPKIADLILGWNGTKKPSKFIDVFAENGDHNIDPNKKYFVEGLEPILLSLGFYFIAWYPSEDWVNSMRETVLSAAPKNLDQVTTITITYNSNFTNT
jgi:hypothetical protein